MLRFGLWTLRIAALSAALMMSSATSSYAARGGGGRGGGFHGGMARGGGFRGGSFGRGGFGRGYGGYGRGYGGYGRGYGGYGGGFYGGYGLGYGLGWGGLGWGGWGWPGYDWWFPNYATYSYPDYYNAYNYYPDYAQYPAYLSGYYSPSVVTPAAQPAAVNVHVPANAQLWFDGVVVTATGEWRSFETPPLDQSMNYHYDVRARWTDSTGYVMDQTRQVTVHAGDLSTLDFLQP